MGFGLAPNIFHFFFPLLHPFAIVIIIIIIIIIITGTTALCEPR
jgi:hypothetical protein